MRGHMGMGRHGKRAADRPFHTYLRLLRYAKPYLPVVILMMVLAFVAAFVGVLPMQVIGAATAEAREVLRGDDSGVQAEGAAAGERAKSARMPSQVSIMPLVRGAANWLGERWSPEGGKALVTFAVLGVFYLGLTLIRSAVSAAQGFAATRVGNGLVYDMRRDVYRHLQRLSLGYFESRPTGDIMSRVVNDVNALQAVVVMPVVQFVGDIAGLAWILVFCFGWDWRLTLVALAAGPFIMVTTFLFGRIIRATIRELREKVGQLNSLVQDHLSGIRIIRCFAREPYEIHRFRRANKENLRLNVKTGRIFATLGPALSVWTAAGAAAVLIYGGTKLARGELAFSVFVTFLLYQPRLFGPITGLSRFYSFIQRALASSERVFEVLDTEPEVREAADAVRLRRVEGRVEFRNVSFAYPNGTKALKDLSFVAEPGQMTALVGPSGAGKTTIINLVGRFYDPVAGSVLLDGMDVRKLKMRFLRRNLGVVLQDPFLFNDTVRANIAYGRLDASATAIEASATAANAHDFIMSLPEKYDTPVGERGVKLSGGEKQRISIARALLADPRILIMDEATSSVDSETEALIQAAMDKLVQNRTTFVIAHRLSTVQRAQQIIVLDQGRVVERGTHMELLERGGLYAHLYAVQFKLIEAPGVDELMRRLRDLDSLRGREPSLPEWPDIGGPDSSGPSAPETL